MSKKILFQFPGQGSQAVGMGTSLADAHPEARAGFDEVNGALGEDLFAMMKDGPEEDLRLTRNAQPALFCLKSCTRLSCVCHVQVNLRRNKLGDEGWCAIFDALRDNPQNKIAKWDLYNEDVGPAVAKSLAAYAAVSASLTEVRRCLACPFNLH